MLFILCVKSDSNCVAVFFTIQFTVNMSFYFYFFTLWLLSHLFIVVMLGFSCSTHWLYVFAADEEEDNFQKIRSPIEDLPEASNPGNKQSSTGTSLSQ